MAEKMISPYKFRESLGCQEGPTWPLKRRPESGEAIMMGTPVS